MTNKKDFNELSMEDVKELKIEFAPGCFDNFEGTQEELDSLMKQIQEMVTSGEILKEARMIDFDNPSADDLEIIEHLTDLESKSRTLQ